MVKRIIPFLLFSVLTFAGCDDDEDMTLTPPSSSTLTLNLTGVHSVENGYHYEGWAIVEGQALTTGKFNVDDQGELVTLDGQIIPNGEFQVNQNLSTATEIVLTIEPAGDTDAVPAETHYLAGSVVSSSANLTVGHSSALGDDFTSATGKYILATPTDGSWVRLQKVV